MTYHQDRQENNKNGDELPLDRAAQENVWNAGLGKWYERNKHTPRHRDGQSGELLLVRSGFLHIEPGKPQRTGQYEQEYENGWIACNLSSQAYTFTTPGPDSFAIIDGRSGDTHNDGTNLGAGASVSINALDAYLLWRGSLPEAPQAPTSRILRPDEYIPGGPKTQAPGGLPWESTRVTR